MRRRSNDNKFNLYKVNVVHRSSDGIFKEREISAKDLKVGQVMKLVSGTKVMADSIVIETDDPLGQCYINTA